jgi:NTE family protein
MLDADDFTRDDRTRAATAAAMTCADNEYSDLVDDEGHQYVDLVMEGGGVLGIALVGYTYVLEKAGIRFLGIGGTSAGAINAIMLAALGKPGDEKCGELARLLANMPIASFIDGDGDARDFSNAVLNKAGMAKLLWKAVQVMDNLRDDLGLHPGDAFLRWLSKALEEAGVRSTTDLQAKLADVPASLRIRRGIRPGIALAPEEKAGRLAMVAADVTTETKAELPRMAELYWNDPDKVNPACFARASMSIPFFFHPFRVRGCPQNTGAQWKRAGYGGVLPQEVIFMDGGIMSNFPINLFHEPYRVPLAPTFGVKIGITRNAPARITKPAHLLSAIFDAARHTLDDDFITQNPDYQQLVEMIDTGRHHWLNFSMSDEDKLDLFARGAEAAAGFLRKFNWHEYKKTREGIAAAFLTSEQAKSHASDGTVIPEN